MGKLIVFVCAIGGFLYYVNYYAPSAWIKGFTLAGVSISYGFMGLVGVSALVLSLKAK